MLAPYKKVPPGLQELAAVLARALPRTLGAHGRLAVVHRESLAKGTFPKEIVTSRFADGTVVRLFCKYTSGHNHNAHGHRGGVALEASVHRELLQPLGICTPALYHVEGDVTGDEVWLIFEYLEHSIRVSDTEGSRSMGLAARWIGEFHAACTERLRTAAMPSLKAYSMACTFWPGSSSRSVSLRPDSSCLRSASCSISSLSEVPSSSAALSWSGVANSISSTAR